MFFAANITVTRTDVPQPSKYASGLRYLNLQTVQDMVLKASSGAHIARGELFSNLTGFLYSEEIYLNTSEYKEIQMFVAAKPVIAKCDCDLNCSSVVSLENGFQYMYLGDERL
jgi:hypothetical protein